MASEQATGDFPVMMASAYANNTYSGEDAGKLWHSPFPPPGAGLGLEPDPFEALKAAEALRQFHLPALQPETAKKEPKAVAEKPKLRLIQVFIVDTDKNVPLDQAMLYRGDPLLTDLTDQELFYEIDIKAILATHNKLRTTLKNKEVKTKAEHLEPIRVRDLTMSVVTIAAF